MLTVHRNSKASGPAGSCCDDVAVSEAKVRLAKVSDSSGELCVCVCVSTQIK